MKKQGFSRIFVIAIRDKKGIQRFEQLFIFFRELIQLRGNALLQLFQLVLLDKGTKDT